MEIDVELNRVGDKAPGKVKSKSHANPGGRNQPYVKGGDGTGDKYGRCARQHGKEVQCPATGVACLNSKIIGHLKAACSKPAMAVSARTSESNPPSVPVHHDVLPGRHHL